jgi:hypothetical protein
MNHRSERATSAKSSLERPSGNQAAQAEARVYVREASNGVNSQASAATLHPIVESSSLMRTTVPRRP